jgi:hypothetical protein
MLDVELDLVQGRWVDNVMKQITSFSNQQYQVPEFRYAEPGLAIKYTTVTGSEDADETNENLFNILSTMFSLGIIEQRKEVITLH